MTSPRIEELLAGGESDIAEFKSRLPDPKTLARLLVAFANTRGGTLIIGVDVDGKPLGLRDDEAVAILHRLRDLASSAIPSETAAGIVDIEGRSVVYLDVPKAPPNIAPLATAEGEFFVRRGAVDQKVEAGGLVREARQTTKPSEGASRSVSRRTPKAARAGRSRLHLFVAMSFAFEEEAALVDYFEAIRRAVARVPRNIAVRRMDLEPGVYEISQAVMDMISDSDIVLADFTRSPHNVYFEAGYARGCGKPVIQTARTGTSLHFDVKTWRTTFFRNATELEEKLVAEISAITTQGRAVSPTRGAPKRRRKRAS